MIRLPKPQADLKVKVINDDKRGSDFKEEIAEGVRSRPPVGVSQPHDDFTLHM